MDSLSRRNAIRVAGGAVGAAGLASAGLLGPGLLSPADAAGARKIRAKLDRSTYQVGEVMVLRFHEKLLPGRKIRVFDSSGLRWKRIKKNDHHQVWTATATRAGVSTVNVKVLWPDGRDVKNRRYRDRISYRVTSKTLGGGGAPLIGMSAPPKRLGPAGT